MFSSAAFCRQDTVACKMTSATYRFPRKEVSIVKSAYEQPNLSFLVLHDDENTGTEAAHSFCSIHGGNIVELQYGNERNITFGSRGSLFSFDPNQIFSNAGALGTLKKYSPSRPGQLTVEKLRGLAFAVLKRYNADSLGYIITLHNNTEGRYNILSYCYDPQFKAVADSVYVNPEMDEDDFTFVTDISFYNYLKKNMVSVVMQSKAARDGSLSVYAQANGIPYINIEVQDGHPEEHLRLIEVVARMMDELKGHDELYARKL